MFHFILVEILCPNLTRKMLLLKNDNTQCVECCSFRMEKSRESAKLLTQKKDKTAMIVQETI